MANPAVLQRGGGPIAGQHYLPCEPEQQFWGWLPGPDDAPCLTMNPGESVTVDTLSHEGLLADQGRDARRFFGSHGVDPDAVLTEAQELTESGRAHQLGPDGPHVVSPPIAIAGAEPGDVLAITVDDMLRRVPYGVISNRHGKGALPGEMPESGATFSAFARVTQDATGQEFGVLPLNDDGPQSVRFPLNPFLGLIGVASCEGRQHSVPPGRHGGNIDINLLTPGSTLYLPVQVPGALAYVGDPHFAQGDGEVALTAMEASLRATLTFDVIKADAAEERFGYLAAPVVETAEYLVPTGLDRDLDLAMQNCVRAALALLQLRYGMSRAYAFAYLSAATDFNISQVVDIVTGVHARIRKQDFAL
ncbi:acetamidase/formamidase family protein [Gordonia sp. DT219]|uniref:acetamidase/formamidase family protein n=1 Tax=Gordonia sp. DT219 TaxID=3416658 RepID=UPI003CEC512A